MQSSHLINLKEKFHLHTMVKPHVSKFNGQPYLKCNDYLDENSQLGWSKDLIKAGADSCPFLCSVCRGLPKFPIEIKSCGDTFCFDCIRDVIRTAASTTGFRSIASCPNCACIFNSEDLEHFETRSRALYRIYTAIDVSCSYGCGYSSSTKWLPHHEMWKCPKRPVTCPNGCLLTLPDKEMEAHFNICEARLVYCNKCRLPKLISEKKHNCVKAFTDTMNCMV